MKYVLIPRIDRDAVKLIYTVGEETNAKKSKRYKIPDTTIEMSLDEVKRLYQFACEQFEPYICSQCRCNYILNSVDLCAICNKNFCPNCLVERDLTSHSPDCKMCMACDYPFIRQELANTIEQHQVERNAIQRQ